MSQWSATKARRVLAALLRTGWRIKRITGSHKTLERPGWADVVFAFLELASADTGRSAHRSQHFCSERSDDGVGCRSPAEEQLHDEQ
jgi:hypothetical protein